MKNFVYGSRTAVESGNAQNDDEKHALISIKTPGDIDAMIKVNENTVGILRLAFHDVDPSEYAEGFQFRKGIVPFSPELAAEVWDFIDALPETCKVIIHCDAGLSRSPGLAAGLSRVLNEDDVAYFENAYPNMLVYRTIIKHRQ